MTYRKPLGRVSAEGRRQIERTRLFAETFLTYAGESELCGDPYEVSDWLARNIWNPLFGTGAMDKRTGRWRRRYRRALIGVHRGFGKSQLAAVIVLTVAVMEPLPNGMYGIVADSKENTKMVKDYIKTIIRQDRALSDQWHVYKDSIRNDLTGQEIDVYPYKEAALQGKHFHVLVGDEIHVWRDEYVWNAAVSGQAKIPNALTIGITTAGRSRDGFLFGLYQKLKRDPYAFVCWLGITDQDDPEDRACWRKVTAAGRVTMEELEEQHEALPPKEFERYYLNRTPMDEREEPFMRRADVEACQAVGASIDWASWFTFAIDGAVRGDTLAVVAAQRQGERWALAEWCWERPDGPMGTYDLMEVADVIRELSARPGSPMGGCDPARLQFLVNWLDRECGISVSDVPQQPSLMCPASERLARGGATHQAALAACPTLAAHCVNAVSSESKAYGRRLASERGRHGHGTRRIDAAVAAAMAMWMYDNNEDETPSVWSIDL